MSDVTLDLAQTDATLTTEADLGNLFSYEVTVDLPHITEATDIKMEIFAIDPVTGLGGFFICDPRVTMVGDGVNVEDGTNKTAPPRTLERKESYPSIVEKGIFEWPGVSTTDEAADTDDNKMKAEFNAMLVPLPEVTVLDLHTVTLT